MIWPIYSIRDNAAASFGMPIVEQNELTAVRGFRFSLSGQGTMGFAPEDYDLYKIGEFDSEKGEVKSQIPVLVISGVSASEKK